MAGQSIKKAGWWLPALLALLGGCAETSSPDFYGIDFAEIQRDLDRVEKEHRECDLVLGIETREEIYLLRADDVLGPVTQGELGGVLDRLSGARQAAVVDLKGNLAGRPTKDLRELVADLDGVLRRHGWQRTTFHRQRRMHHKLESCGSVDYWPWGSGKR